VIAEKAALLKSYRLHSDSAAACEFEIFIRAKVDQLSRNFVEESQ